MRRLIIIAFILISTSGIAFAEGDQKQGTKSPSTLSTGTDSQGDATQDYIYY